MPKPPPRQPPAEPVATPATTSPPPEPPGEPPPQGWDSWDVERFGIDVAELLDAQARLQAARGEVFDALLPKVGPAARRCELAAQTGRELSPHLPADGERALDGIVEELDRASKTEDAVDALADLLTAPTKASEEAREALCIALRQRLKDPVGGLVDLLPAKPPAEPRGALRGRVSGILWQLREAVAAVVGTDDAPLWRYGVAAHLEGAVDFLVAVLPQLTPGSRKPSELLKLQAAVGEMDAEDSVRRQQSRADILAALLPGFAGFPRVASVLRQAVTAVPARLADLQLDKTERAGLEQILTDLGRLADHEEEGARLRVLIIGGDS